MSLFDLEKTILEKLDDYISESYLYENYSLNPVDYNSETQVSFELVDGENKIADVKIKKIDGTPVDAVNSMYDFGDVYAEITTNLEGKETNYSLGNVNAWLMNKLKEMGYDLNPAIIDGEETPFPDEALEPKEDDLETIKKNVEDVDDKDINTDSEFSLDDLEFAEV
jgi:hypothetical protein